MKHPICFELWCSKLLCKLRALQLGDALLSLIMLFWKVLFLEDCILSSKDVVLSSCPEGSLWWQGFVSSLCLLFPGCPFSVCPAHCSVRGSEWDKWLASGRQGSKACWKKKTKQNVFLVCLDFNVWSTVEETETILSSLLHPLCFQWGVNCEPCPCPVALSVLPGSLCRGSLSSYLRANNGTHLSHTLIVLLWVRVSLITCPMLFISV